MPTGRQKSTYEDCGEPTMAGGGGGEGEETCPSCRMPFDKGKKRKLIDACGHERCYSCMFDNDRCPLCSMTNVTTTKISKTLNLVAHGRQKSDSGLVVNARPGLKTNGHFTTFMQNRRETAGAHVASKDRPPICRRDPKIQSPRSPGTSWSQRRRRPPQVPAPRVSDRGSAFSDEEPIQGGQAPPPAPESARNDLFVRLGLLLGDRGGARAQRNAYAASMSSLTGSEATGNTSPLSTLTVSSGPDCSQDGGRDPSSESMASLASGSTATTASPSGTVPRRHSLNVSPPQADNSYIRLKPLFFEVPSVEDGPPFVGRQWLFEEMDDVLQSEDAGVVLTGGTGTGKTSVILQLVEHSCFGRRKDEPLYYEIYDCGAPPQYLSRSGSRASLTASRALPSCGDRLRNLGCRVVAFHFCQADDSATCSVPELVHSLAAQMCQAPRLAAYRECLLANPDHQRSLSMAECVANPSKALTKGVLEPLRSLQGDGKICPEDACLVLVDALNEAEFHRPDFGDTVASFLARHSTKFPPWMKLVLTVRSAARDAIKRFPYRSISLDPSADDENSRHDLFEFISYRVGRSAAIRGNVTFNGKLDGCSTAKFTQYLLQLSKGCFLYAKLVLDLVERGNLVTKSSSYKVLPISLAQVYLLHFNLRFPSTVSFRKVAPVLSTCLASLYPLNKLEIYHSVNAGVVGSFVSWEDFATRMDALAWCLAGRQDGTYMFFHPSFREWLVHRPPGESSDFVCDPRQGHANIALRLSRLEFPLGPEKVAELGHHVLKAHIYKVVGRKMPVLPRDAQALWVCLCADDASAALVSPRNLFSPNVKVSRLLLLAGADPNSAGHVLDGAPALAVAANEGFTDMAVTLIEFGADVDAVSGVGATALALACANGHLDAVKLLLAKGASPRRADNEGMYPLAHAARNAHLQTVSFLAQYCWADAIQQALVAGAFSGHTVVCEFLLNLSDSSVNAVDATSGETALTAASSRGRKETCAFLVRRGAAAATLNGRQVPPLSRAVREGHRDVAHLLLTQAKAAVDQPDGEGMTPLMHAASEGCDSSVRTLLAHGASVSKVDGRGLSALCWACVGGHLQTATTLLGQGSSVHHTDSTGRTPLDLAAEQGDPRLVQLLLSQGAMVEHVDHAGTRPLDRAIGCGNSAVVICFLKKGAKLGPGTWAVAADKPDITLVLLTKLLEDGMALYKKTRLKDAAYRFQYALKKFPGTLDADDERPFDRLRLDFLLNLSKCHRKMNEPDSASKMATEALMVDPRCYEAYCARARARRDLGRPLAALDDMTEAVKLAPDNKELQRVADKMREEMRGNVPNVTTTNKVG